MSQFRSRRSLFAVLGVVFLFNVVENYGESEILKRLGHRDRGVDNATTLSRSENSPLLFEGHTAVHRVVIYATSAIYFAAFPAMLLIMLTVTARSTDIRDLKLYVLAMTIDYFLSLVVFLILPVPERWLYPDSGAALLSNRWSNTFIEAIRPFSGISHGLPSFHTSAAVIVACIAWCCGHRYRWTATVLAMMVMLSTIVLGIHWIVDVAAGVGAGILSFAVAYAVTFRNEVSSEVAFVYGERP
jgi:membrane-associated phospholipid phosphatase